MSTIINGTSSAITFPDSTVQNSAGLAAGGTIATGTVTTLTTTTLSDGTNSTSSTNCIQGSAKAWVQFTGSTGTRNGSYNVSSVTRASTGTYTINFTTAMPNANYAISGFNTGDSVYNGTGVYVQQLSAPTTSSFAITTRTNGGTYSDPIQVHCAVFSS